MPPSGSKPPGMSSPACTGSSAFSETGTKCCTAPAGKVRAAPVAIARLPPCGPITATVSALGGGTVAVTVMIPFSRIRPLNGRDGETW